MTNNIINELKGIIAEQAAQIKQLSDANAKMMMLLNHISSAEMPADGTAAVELCETAVVTREFIEFEAIRKISHLTITGVKRAVAAMELSMLIKDDEVNDYELINEFNNIINKHIYQKFCGFSDCGVKEAVELLNSLGYETISTPKGSLAVGPYWERIIGSGERIDTLYRPSFRLRYDNNGTIEYFYLKGICSVR